MKAACRPPRPVPHRTPRGTFLYLIIFHGQGEGNLLSSQVMSPAGTTLRWFVRKQDGWSRYARISGQDVTRSHARCGHIALQSETLVRGLTLGACTGRWSLVDRYPSFAQADGPRLPDILCPWPDHLLTDMLRSYRGTSIISKRLPTPGPPKGPGRSSTVGS